jgi:hypothetical protein
MWQLPAFRNSFVIAIEAFGRTSRKYTAFHGAIKKNILNF